LSTKPNRGLIEIKRKLGDGKGSFKTCDREDLLLSLNSSRNEPLEDSPATRYIDFLSLPMS
jgi:hypothetical protein